MSVHINMRANGVTVADPGELAGPARTGSAGDLRDAGVDVLDRQRPGLLRLRDQWRGESPAAYLSAVSRDALDKRLGKLGANFPRLVVNSLAERLTLKSVTIGGDADPSLFSEFKGAGGVQLAEQIHTDRLLFGSAYVTVWADEYGRATLTGDTPLTMTHGADPATGEVLWALRCWSVGDGGAAVLYERDRITFWKSELYSPGAASTWQSAGVLDNPLGVVPVVPFTRRTSLSDPLVGSSVVADVLDLSDAVAKLLSDSMVTSEFYVRPRRWATGLEIEEDEDGNIVDPFGKGRFLQSESPDTKFGQLDGSRLDGYADLIATLTQQIGALTGLPAHYLGLHGDQPPNADSVRAAEAQLTSRAYTEQSALSRPWSTVAWLLDAVRGKSAADSTLAPEYGVLWESPEIRTPAQAADVAVKLRSIGVPLADVLADPMGYSPDRVAAIVSAADREAVILAATSRNRP